MIVGIGGFVLRTTDAGHTWQEQVPPVDRSLEAVVVVDDRIATAVGDWGIVLRSSHLQLTRTAAASRR